MLKMIVSTEEELGQAIRTLQDACDDVIVLMHDIEVDVYLVPIVLEKHRSLEVIDGEESWRPEGTIEYQVSDGLPGVRGTSWDFYNLREAILAFKYVQKVGWDKAKGDKCEAFIKRELAKQRKVQ